MRVFIISLLMMAVLCHLKSSAQTMPVFGVQSLDLVTAIQSTSPDTTVSLTIHAVLEDTLSIDTVVIRVGSIPTVGDIVEQSFVFDSSQNLPSSISYTRSGFDLYLALGTFTYQRFFYEIQLIYSNGTRSLVTAGVKE